ncbi:aminopeptidase P family protein [Terasakiella sp. A23]|uniref:aminopeptidase P family protein n=1 Tax=Terasakiella sp. FCG-A23 TaxID=3080561 RepID=UPI002954A05A|nr:aminopeptidase P family protein [Terasakiella sp. A23]MDV7338177.1 aminopeptidase P family protein [Terasakiella sp. A23]
MTDRAARLKRLRAEMKTFEMDGFIVPRADEHQGEYVAPCSERLSWISGFTGSAGMAIVLQEKAAVFVDGRYTLQIEQEVDNDLFDYRHISESPATDWVANYLKEGMALSYDPWLHTGAGLHRLKLACEKLGAKLKPAPHNFIDAIWADRPEPPLEPVRVHPLDCSGQAHGEKLADMGKTLSEAGQDAMVLTLPDSIAWTFNIRGGDIPCTPVALGFAIIYADATADLFMDGRKISDEVKTHLGADVRIHEPGDIGAVLDGLGADEKTVRIDGTYSPEWVHSRLKAAGAKVVMGDDLSLLPKACKNDVEVDGMREAHRRDGAVMVKFLHWLSKQKAGPDLNELSVSNKLDSIRAEDGLFFDYSFPTISGAAENGAIVHYRVSPETSIPLPENGLYLVDSGAQYLDGTTDITRTVVRGTPTDEMKDRYTRVLKGHIAISSTRFPKGTTGSQLDVLARRPLWQAGMDYDHGTGHGVGSFLNVHEGPHRISKMPSKVGLEVGMVVSNEPGYYKTGEYGIRLENLICVQASEGGEREMRMFEPLTLCPFDRKGIELSLLSKDEIDWINDYHKTVRDQLTPLLDGDDLTWLIEATESL